MIHNSFEGVVYIYRYKSFEKKGYLIFKLEQRVMNDEDSKSNKKKPRVVTSAINGMSVSEVRKCLDIMRKQWRDKSSTSPFFICDKFSNGTSMDDFAFKFVMGHHFKRHNKQTQDVVQRA